MNLKPHIYFFQNQWYCDSNWDLFKCVKTADTPEEAYLKWRKAWKH